MCTGDQPFSTAETYGRAQAWQLLTEWTQSESQRKHALAVEACVAASGDAVEAKKGGPAIATVTPAASADAASHLSSAPRLGFTRQAKIPRSNQPPIMIPKPPLLDEYTIPAVASGATTQPTRRHGARFLSSRANAMRAGARRNAANWLCQ